MNPITRPPADDDAPDAVLRATEEPPARTTAAFEALLDPAPAPGPAADGATASAPAPAAAPADAPARPRTRWAGVLWGLVFLAIAVFGILAVTVPGVWSAVASLVFGDPVSFVLTGVIAFGVLVLIIGLSGMLVRRGRRSA